MPNPRLPGREPRQRGLGAHTPGWLGGKEPSIPSTRGTEPPAVPEGLKKRRRGDPELSTDSGETAGPRRAQRFAGSRRSLKKLHGADFGAHTSQIKKRFSSMPPTPGLGKAACVDVRETHIKET